MLEGQLFHCVAFPIYGRTSCYLWVGVELESCLAINLLLLVDIEKLGQDGQNVTIHAETHA